MPLSEVINVGRWSEPDWLRFHHDLATYTAVDGHCFHNSDKPANELVRKGWEWTQCIYGLAQLGVIRPDARALGVGAGREPVIFWLSDRVGEVIATDLYGNEEWSNNAASEASSEVVTNPERFCPRPFDSNKVKFEVADGTKLPYKDESFDLVWSLSSVEHFGGHAAASMAVREMARVLKPGGVACVATEYLLLEEQNHVDFFNRQQVESCLIGATPALSLVDGMNWDLPPSEFLIDSIKFPEAVDRRRRHIVLNNGLMQWTSIILFLRKTLPSTKASLQSCDVAAQGSVDESLRDSRKPLAQPKAATLIPTQPVHRPDLTNWRSDTHKGTKLEQPGAGSL